MKEMTFSIFCGIIWAASINGLIMKGSTAEKYAKKYGLKFKEISSHENDSEK